jgi:hypothetical protein
MTTLSKFEDQWLGDKQIKFIEEREPSKSGVELVSVVFNDGTRQEYSKLMLEQEGVVTPQIQDLTAFRDKRILPIVKEVLKMLLKYNVKIEELDYLMQQAFTSVNMNLQKAEANFWGVERLGQQTLVQVDDVLLNSSNNQ